MRRDRQDLGHYLAQQYSYMRLCLTVTDFVKRDLAATTLLKRSHTSVMANETMTQRPELETIEFQSSHNIV